MITNDITRIERVVVDAASDAGLIPLAKAKRYVVARDDGDAFDVIEGVKLNDEPVSKEIAEALAGRPN